LTAGGARPSFHQNPVDCSGESSPM
jgi:hypothetical protein